MNQVIYDLNLWFPFKEMLFQNQSTADEVSCIGNMQLYKGTSTETYPTNEATQVVQDTRETYQIVPQETYQLAPSHQFQHICSSCQLHSADSGSGMFETQDDSLCSEQF